MEQRREQLFECISQLQNYVDQYAYFRQNLDAKADEAKCRIHSVFEVQRSNLNDRERYLVRQVDVTHAHQMSLYLQHHARLHHLLGSARTASVAMAPLENTMRSNKNNLCAIVEKIQDSLKAIPKLPADSSVPLHLSLEQNELEKAISSFGEIQSCAILPGLDGKASILPTGTCAVGEYDDDNLQEKPLTPPGTIDFKIPTLTSQEKHRWLIGDPMTKKPLFNLNGIGLGMGSPGKSLSGMPSSWKLMESESSNTHLENWLLSIKSQTEGERDIFDEWLLTKPREFRNQSENEDQVDKTRDRLTSCSTTNTAVVSESIVVVDMESEGSSTPSSVSSKTFSKVIPEQCCTCASSNKDLMIENLHELTCLEDRQIQSEQAIKAFCCNDSDKCQSFGDCSNKEEHCFQTALKKELSSMKDMKNWLLNVPKEKTVPESVSSNEMFNPLAHTWQSLQKDTSDKWLLSSVPGMTKNNLEKEESLGEEKKPKSWLLNNGATKRSFDEVDEMKDSTTSYFASDLACSWLLPPPAKQPLMSTFEGLDLSKLRLEDAPVVGMREMLNRFLLAQKNMNWVNPSD